MSARDINLDYGEDGRTLQQATLAGQSAIQLAGAGGAAGQQLRGGLEVRSPGRKCQQPVGATEHRGHAAGDRRRRGAHHSLERPHGYRRRQGPVDDAVPGGRELHRSGDPHAGCTGRAARTLDAALDPAPGRCRKPTFTTFHFTDGPLTATSNLARYRIAAGTLALSGKQGDADPQIKDDVLTIDAETIDVTLNPRKMVRQAR